MVALQGTMGHTQLSGIVIAVAFFLIPILQAMIIILVDGSQPIE
jgi:hypothetical protein